jgi:hypothetical protein
MPCASTWRTARAVNRAWTCGARAGTLPARRVPFAFIEVREGPAVYYIAEFKFLNREWRHFAWTFGRRTASERHEVKFKRQMYREQ